MHRPLRQANAPLTAQPSAGRQVALRVLTLAFSAVWVVAVGMTQFENWQTAAPLALAMACVVTVVPVFLALVLADALLRLRGLKAQIAALQDSIDDLRQPQSQAMLPRQSATGAARTVASLSGRSKTRSAATFTPPRAASAPSPNAPSVLALGPKIDASSAQISVEDWLRALHFPNSPSDAEGLRAVRLALADRSTAKLIRAAQDVLTLLAEDGVFMDNVSPDRTKFDLWRRFAAGERGGPICDLGGVRDQSYLAISAERMRNDPVFRDAVHHFLGSFNRALVALEPRATNGDLSALSNTRTARAFMLLGRVSGTFD